MSKLDTSKTRWDLSKLVTKESGLTSPSSTQEIEELTSAFVKKWKERTDYLSDPKVLKEALDEYDNWLTNCVYGGREGFYWWLKSSEDELDTDTKAANARIDNFAKQKQLELQFFSLNVAKIPADKQDQFLSYTDLAPYKHSLEKSFSEAKYLLTEGEERIMTLKSTAAHENWVNLTSEFLSKEEKEIELSDGKKGIKPFEELISMCESSDTVNRTNAAQAANEILSRMVDLAVPEMNSILANKKVDDEIRSFERPDSVRHLADDMDTSVVDTAVKTITSRFDIANRFYELKAKLLGQKTISYFERNLQPEKVDKVYNWDDSVALVDKVFGNLDPEFQEIFRMFVEKGHIDVYPRKGKSHGAFCVYFNKQTPTYILLNHTDRLRDVTTLAHESGHGINDEFMKRKQNEHNFGTPTSTAEVASTFMEDFVLKELLNDVTDEEKFNIQMTKLNDDMSTIFRQIAFYNFESDLHREFREKGFLSKHEIGEIFKTNISKYLGPSVELPEGAENWWVYVGHFRRFFYVYSYATGILISKFMQNQVKADHAFINKVKEFLSTGLSDSPKNIFAKMGINIADKAFWEKGLSEVESLLKDTTELAKKLKKI